MFGGSRKVCCDRVCSPLPHIHLIVSLFHGNWYCPGHYPGIGGIAITPGLSYLLYPFALSVVCAETGRSSARLERGAFGAKVAGSNQMYTVYILRAVCLTADIIREAPHISLVELRNTMLARTSRPEVVFLGR